jgi:hypothetical protein
MRTQSLTQVAGRYRHVRNPMISAVLAVFFIASTGERAPLAPAAHALDASAAHGLSQGYMVSVLGVGAERARA